MIYQLAWGIKRFEDRGARSRLRSVNYRPAIRWLGPSCEVFHGVDVGGLAVARNFGYQVWVTAHHASRAFIAVRGQQVPHFATQADRVATATPPVASRITASAAWSGRRRAAFRSRPRRVAIVAEVECAQGPCRASPARTVE